MWKYYVLRLAYLLLSRLPVRMLYAIARVFGDGAYLVRAGTRKAVTANMRRVMGPEADEREVRRAAREVFRNATRYYADLLHIQHLDIQAFSQNRVEIEGIEYLAEAHRSGRGAVVVGAHFGNPEMSVQGVAAAGLSLFGFTEPLEPPALSDFTNRLRSRHGHIYSTVGYRSIREAMRRLKDGGLLAVLLVRDITGTGIPMTFFGAEAKIPVGGIDLALRTGADLILAKSWRLPGYRFRVQIEPPLEVVRTGDMDADVRANAQRVLAMLEEQIRSDPGQWAVLERIWPQNERERPDS